jgi:hypothetical protein
MHLMVATRSVSRMDWSVGKRISARRSRRVPGRTRRRRWRRVDGRRSWGTAWSGITCHVRRIPRSPHHQGKQENERRHDYRNRFTAYLIFPILIIPHAPLHFDEGEKRPLLAMVPIVFSPARPRQCQTVCPTPSVYLRLIKSAEFVIPEGRCW